MTVNDHRYGLLDRDAGGRAYGGKSSGKKMPSKFWLGGFGQIGADGFTGGMLASELFSASEQEYNHLIPLVDKIEKALGAAPETISGDCGYGVTKVYRELTLRGIASVFPFRAFGNFKQAGDMRTEDWDEHGPRCGFCGAPGITTGARLGIQRKASGARSCRR